MFPATRPRVQSVRLFEAGCIRRLTIIVLVNFFADPYAVKELLCDSPGLPLDRFVLLPLDITTPHELPFAVYREQVDPLFQLPSAPTRSPLTHFTSSFLEQTRVVMLQFGKDAMELHDIVAVWCAMQDPSEVEKGEERPFLANRWKGAYRHFQIERYCMT